MEYIKYFNEFQFLNDFTFELKRSIGTQYQISTNISIGAKQIDLFIEDMITGYSYTIEVKGDPKNKSLPPEIIPWLLKTKSLINNPKNYFIILSLSDVRESIREIFFKNGLIVFEYQKHKENLINDFLLTLKEIPHNKDC